VSVRPFTVLSPAGATLQGYAHHPPGSGPHPAVVICHGFKGFMDWGFFPALAELLAERGFVAVRFNLSGAGVAPGDDVVSDPEAFRRDTYSLELSDLLAVLAAVGGEAAGGQGLDEAAVDPARIGLFGHSRGGGVALLAAAAEAWRDRLGALVTWAAIAHVDRFSAEEKTAWRRDGELPVVNARTGQRLALGRELLADVEDNREALDLGAAAARRRAPWLIVHAADDESVPAAEGENLLAAAAPPREIQRINTGGHTFGARHPFTGPTPPLIAAMNATQTWFRRHL
jgi:dienelactone hydrolase